MARKSNQQPSLKSQKAKSTKLTIEQKKEMVNILKDLKEEQTTFNADPISELVADGEVENAV